MKKLYFNFMSRTCPAMLALLLTSTLALGQQGTVKGKITDESGAELIGATVSVEGTTVGTVTDALGNYSLYLGAGTHNLRASYIGFEAQTATVTITNAETATLDFALVEGRTLSEVVVIGTRNQNRTVLETPVPVDVIDVSELMEIVPQVEIGDILNYVAPSFASNKQSINDGSDHVDPATLRGLGVDHVLVLINGKRRHNSALVNVNASIGRGSVGTDLNTIPAAAIQRIEILRDGAAALYGSDAIAGVINIVLKDNVDKVYLSGTAGQHKEGDGERLQFNFNYGFKVGDNGFVNLTGQYQYRGRIDRAGAWPGNVYKTNGSGIFAEDFAEGDFSPFDVGRRLTAQEAAAINAANAITNNMTDAEQEAKINANGGRRAFSMQVGQSEVTNNAVMLNSAFDLGKNAQLYMFGGINSRRGLASGFYRLPNQSRTLTTIYPNGFLPEINSRIFDGSLTGGVRGVINGWNVDFSNAYGINAFRFLITNTHNASRGTSSPTSFDAGGFSFAQNTSNLDFTRYFENALNGINVAFGAMYRTETYSIIAGEEGSYRNYGSVSRIDTVRDGATSILIDNTFSQQNIFYGRPGGSQVFPGFQPANELKQSRGNLGLYVNSDLQFTPAFFVDVALRFEDYTDFGNTFNWKLAARLETTETTAVRAAVSTGFRAPSLQQRYFNTTSTVFQTDPVTNQVVPREQGTFSNDSRIAKLFGIPNLTNESSLNISAGITWDILKNLQLTLDGYLIDITDRIILTNSFGKANSEEISALLSQANAETATFFVNALDTRTQGLDFILTHKATWGKSTLNTSLSANFTKTEVQKLKIPETLTGAPERFFSRRDKNRFEDALPQSKINLMFNYRLSRFSSNLSLVRFGEIWRRQGVVSDPSSWLDQQYAGKITTDLSLGYNITNAFNLTIGSNNLFNVYPDENRQEFRSNERFIYGGASQFGFNGAFYYARINFNF